MYTHVRTKGLCELTSDSRLLGWLAFDGKYPRAFPSLSLAVSMSRYLPRIISERLPILSLRAYGFPHSRVGMFSKDRLGGHTVSTNTTVVTQDFTHNSSVRRCLAARIDLG